MTHESYGRPPGDLIINCGRVFFGTGLLGIGLQFFVYKTFIPVIAP